MGHSPTLEIMVSEVAKIMNVASVDPDIGLGDLGIDSLRVVELILVCDQLYGKEINPELLVIDQFTTLRELDRQLSVMPAKAA